MIFQHIWEQDFAHWFNFYFAGRDLPQVKNVWYERAVWGNVFAIIPTAIVLTPIGWASWVWHKGVVEDLEKEIAEHKLEHHKLVQKTIKFLDPEEGEPTLASISDSLDLETDGGLKTIHDKLTALAEKVGH